MKYLLKLENMELFEYNIHKNIIPGMFSIYKHMASENIYEGQWLAIMTVKVLRLKPNFPILLQRFDFVPNFGFLLQWSLDDTILWLHELVYAITYV